MNKAKRFTALILTFCLVFSVSVSVYAKADSNEIITQTAKNIIGLVTEPTISQVGGEWTVIGLAGSGYDVPEGYFDTYYKNVENYVKESKGVLHDKKYTEYSRVILALTSIGKNPEDVAGYNLISPICDYDKVIWQGLNGPVFALVALDSKNYEIPSNSAATRQKYVDYIVNSQNTDGGFSLSKNAESDIDITSMAIVALSNYRDDSNVKNAIDRALSYISNNQTEGGTFMAKGVVNSESSAQVLTALSALEIKLDDQRFVKNGSTVLDGLMSFYVDNQGFLHTKDDDKINLMATEQCFCALVSLDRLQRGENTLYDMSDIAKTDSESVKEIAYEYVNKMPVTYSGKTFLDISNHSSKMQIEELASRNIINGKSKDMFEPDSTMTRAEFATIVVKSLGIDVVSESCFEDVRDTDWFYSYVATAYKRGIVNGVSDVEFNPSGVITKEEAAVMVARASSFCDMNINYDDISTRNVLAAFTDYISSASWARSSLAFCYDKGILNDSDIEIQPKKYVTRAEIAVMLYNLLDLADLL